MDFLKEYVQDEIYLRHALDETPDGRGFDFHVHDKCEIFFFVSGSAEYLVEGSVYPLTKGSVLIMRPGEAHCIRILKPEKYERYAVNFPISMFDSIDPERMLTSIYTERELGRKNLYFAPGLETVFEDMCREYPDTYARKIKINVGILKILDILANLYQNPESENNEPGFEEQMVAYVNEHLFDAKDADSLAGHFFLSRSQFGRVFKKATGASPWNYIIAKRLIAAKNLIDSGVSAKKAAEDCSFADYSSFYRAFVKKFGKSPTGPKKRSDHPTILPSSVRQAFPRFR